MFAGYPMPIPVALLGLNLLQKLGEIVDPDASQILVPGNLRKDGTPQGLSLIHI